MPNVAIYKCDEYNTEKIKELIKKGIEELNIRIDDFDNWLLKPNLLMRKNPEDAVTTHPSIVQAIGEILTEKGKKAVIADSPGGPYTVKRLDNIYSASGLKEVALKTNINLNMDVGYKEVELLGHQTVRKIYIINPYFDTNAVISLAKLKTHRMAVYTGTVKNLFGLIPGGYKAELHFRVQEVERFMDLLLDMYLTIKPKFGIIDGIVGMEGEGPSAGKPRKIGVILISEDLIAADYIACKIIGLDVNDVPLLKRAKERGLLNGDKISVVGEDIEKLIIEDFDVPLNANISFIRDNNGWLKKFVNSLLIPKPIFDHKKCIGCAECFASCPPKAIEMKKRKPYVDLKKCIRCYCCHELCPAKAITIKRSLIFEKVIK